MKKWAFRKSFELYLSLLVGIWITPWSYAYDYAKAQVKKMVAGRQDRLEMYVGNYSQGWFAQN